MNPRLLIGFSFAVAALTACGGNATLTYTVKANVAESGHRAELFEASERMMERRLAAAEVKNAEVAVLPAGGDTATMTLKLPNSSAVETAERILAEHFTFDIRLEGASVPATEETEWIPTGVKGSMLTWVRPVTNSTDEIGVELQFTQEGRDELAKAFKGNTGKSIGIFVRDLLVSKMSIASETVGTHIVIGGVPSFKVAQIFAEDVNVGLHVTFTPAP